VVVMWCGFFTDYNTTPTKVVLSCFGLLVGLWQFGWLFLTIPGTVSIVIFIFTLGKVTTMPQPYNVVFVVFNNKLQSSSKTSSNIQK
jgi:hypothetical protein